jgi:single-strand DNA-binding protein
MSKSVNKIILVGRVGADPEIRATTGGSRVAKFSLATDRRGANAKTDWHRLVTFGKLTDVVEQYVRKGDLLYIEGRVEYSQTQGDAGPKYFTDVVANELTMLGSKGERTEDPITAKASASDEIPF